MSNSIKINDIFSNLSERLVIFREPEAGLFFPFEEKINKSGTAIIIKKVKVFNKNKPYSIRKSIRKMSLSGKI